MERFNTSDTNLIEHIALTAAAMAAIVGLLWWNPMVGVVALALISSRVGFRKRTILFMLIPVINVFIVWPYLALVAWRLTSRHVTWVPRFDRPSWTIFTLWHGEAAEQAHHAQAFGQDYGYPAGQFPALAPHFSHGDNIAPPPAR